MDVAVSGPGMKSEDTPDAAEDESTEARLEKLALRHPASWIMMMRSRRRLRRDQSGATVRLPANQRTHATKRIHATNDHEDSWADRRCDATAHQ